MIDIEKPIKQGGLHEVSVKLHTQVTAILKVNVKVEGAENAPAPAPEAAAE